MLFFAGKPKKSAAFFLNPFTGKAEEYTTHGSAMNSMLQAAAVRIRRLEQEVQDLRDIVARQGVSS